MKAGDRALRPQPIGHHRSTERCLMSRMGIPPIQQFINGTTVKDTSLAKKVKKKVTGRGAKMALIDAALGEWEGVYQGNAVPPKIKALSHIVSACSWWLSLKANKQSDFSVQRKLRVEGIRTAAIKALGQLDPGQGAFAQKKSDAILGGQVTPQANLDAKTVKFSGGGGTKSLDQGYHHERGAYKASGKTKAPSAGAVRGEWETTQGHDWGNITG